MGSQIEAAGYNSYANKPGNPNANWAVDFTVTNNLDEFLMFLDAASACFNQVGRLQVYIR